MKVEIKSRWSASALFSFEAANNSIRLTLEAGTRQGADLRGADLYGADLRGANLRGADLRGAKIEEDNELIGERPFFTIGPIGSRRDVLLAFSTQKGLRIRAGCFFGDKESFLTRLEDSHGDNTHGREYKSALVLIEAHFSLWNKES